MKSKSKLLTPILGGLFLIIVVLMVVASQQSGPTFTPPTLPLNNGYDQLLQAAKLISKETDKFNDLDDEVDLAKLEQIVKQNRPALKLVDEALGTDILVPVDWSADPGSKGSLRLQEINSLRSIARALAAQTRWQRTNGDLAAAVDSAGKTFQLGTVCGRGGLLNDYLVGLAVQGMGLDALRRVDTDDVELLQSAMNTLLSNRNAAETADEVLSREIAYVNAKLTGFKGWMMRKTLSTTFEPAEQSARAAENRVAAQQGLLLLHLALHQFHSNRGGWPNALVELPAIHLSPQPLDPFSDRPFIYRRTDDGYLLYSVGENMLDDDGQTDENGLQPDLVFDLMPTTP